jgi:hypothetical protein
MPDNGWSRAFDDPIVLPDGRELVTLRDAAEHVQRLPKATQKQQEWLRAVRILIATAEGRDFLMHSRIAMMQAICQPRRTGPKGAFSAIFSLACIAALELEQIVLEEI